MTEQEMIYTPEWICIIRGKNGLFQAQKMSNKNIVNRKRVKYKKSEVVVFYDSIEQMRIDTGFTRYRIQEMIKKGEVEQC